MASVIYSRTGTVAVVIGSALLIRLGYAWLWPKPIPGIPHNPVTSIWGDVPAIIKADKEDKMSFVEFLAHMAKKHGSICQVLVGRQSLVIVSDRKEMERILTDVKIGDQTARVRTLFGMIIPNSQIALPANETWKRHRRLSGPSMTQRYLKRMSVRIAASAGDLARYWNAKADIVGSSTFEAGLDIQRATMDNIINITLGYPLGCVDSARTALPTEQVPVSGGIAQLPRSDPPPLYGAINKMFESLDRVSKVAFPLLHAYIFSYASPSWRKQYNLIRSFLNNAILEARVRESTLGQDGGNLTTDADCVLDMIIQREAREGTEKFEKGEILDELMMYVLAGQDTTAAALKWMVKYLPTDIDIQHRLHDEVCSVFGQELNADEPLDFNLLDDTERVPVLEAVVAETLRCAGVGSLVSRDLLQDEMVLGKFVPKGTNLMFATALLSKDESEWGPDAHEWRPSRWLTPSGAFDRSAGPSFPFGLGPRACFGQRLALLQLKTFAATLSRSFLFKPVQLEVGAWDAIESITKQPKMCYVSLERWKAN
ncbi:Putative cytochrome P450 CYP13A10 [Caenorhabditis elegans] [Rhizoctonia solani]|uniref:Putative cytochrome P450 CYP13A10 [Caenorhabditis elegans] n=1 Tax=Rhizoctonia solani TaxID=456999 RepID=A0A0K6GF14_9AGAM|nr:Putative cytochrome P450 CYP13A10 [Caenorhabditis elegans] [Rhizoctonia solani]